MNSKFIKINNQILVDQYSEDSKIDKVPNKIYTVKIDERGNFYLEYFLDKFKLPEKIYGDPVNKKKKIINTFLNRTKSLGILLTGKKGSGKTLLTMTISNELIEKYNLPVITINDSFKGESFLKFINSLGECVLIFDEFSKTYRSSNEEGERGTESLLGLFDGPMASKKLIFLTENKKYSVSDYYMGRPGRIYYHFEYPKLDYSVIEDYYKDIQIPQNVIKEIQKYYPEIFDFSFDVLEAITKEWLLYQEPIEELVKGLNISLELGKYNYYLISSFSKRDNKKVIFNPKISLSKNTTMNLCNESQAASYFTEDSFIRLANNLTYSNWIDLNMSKSMSVLEVFAADDVDDPTAYFVDLTAPEDRTKVKKLLDELFYSFGDGNRPTNIEDLRNIRTNIEDYIIKSKNSNDIINDELNHIRLLQIKDNKILFESDYYIFEVEFEKVQRFNFWENF